MVTVVRWHVLGLSRWCGHGVLDCSPSALIQQNPITPHVRAQRPLVSVTDQQAHGFPFGSFDGRASAPPHGATAATVLSLIFKRYTTRPHGHANCGS
jgi:hypothetical protein